MAPTAINIDESNRAVNAASALKQTQVLKHQSTKHAVPTGPQSKQTSGLNVGALLSEAAKSMPPSAIRSLLPLEQTPGMLSLLAGKPNPETFPFNAITLELKPEYEGGEPVQVRIDGKDLDEGLQYSFPDGIKSLNGWLVDWQTRIHGRQAVKRGEEHDGMSSWRVSVGMGSQDLLTKTFSALLNPGDSCLVENPVYTGILPTLQILRSNIVAVATDEEGLCPNSLHSILASWSHCPSTREHPFPKFVYTTPTGSNPAGTTASEERKRDVLAVVRQFGILLLEDDPYLFLSFEGLGEEPVTRIRSRSYWSLEMEDRDKFGDGFVARFDSFSKILAGGLRLGFMSGPVSLLDAVDTNTAAANLQPSGVAQSIAYALLKHWGHAGFLRHLDRTATFYKLRRDTFEAQAQAILRPENGKPVAEWVTPVAGMFLWLRLLGVEDSFALISKKAKEAGVLAVPGLAFIADGSRTSYVRTSFSIIDEADVGEALRRLRAVVEASWKEEKLVGGGLVAAA